MVAVVLNVQATESARDSQEDGKGRGGAGEEPEELNGKHERDVHKRADEVPPVAEVLSSLDYFED